MAQDPRRNYFVDGDMARRYAEYRPAFHAGVVGRIQTVFGLTGPVPRALDVACGTGQSTLPLLDIADRVTGVDVSLAMLHEASRDARIDYVVARAEALPLHSGTIDLVTVALAFHWFDRDAFLREARRVLRPGGMLVLYNNAFLGYMAEDRAFEDWFRKVYLARYPTPARASDPLTDEQAAAHGLRIVAHEQYTNSVRFTPERLARYFATQSNVTAAVESGAESLDDALTWIERETARVVPASGGTFAFGGPVTYLVKEA